MQEIRFGLVLLLLLSSAQSAMAARSIHLTGQNDIAVDRAAIQTAVDSAGPGDTIVLDGTFQLDGTPIFVRQSRLSIVGRALDDDGDGATNEDRADGIDNDGDGLVDEDGWNAVLRGIDDGNGGPALDVFPNRFNDGFEILGFDQKIDHLVFRDLEFNQVNRAIYLFPDYDDAGTVLLCSTSTPRNGSMNKISISNNAFVNGFRGVEILGRVKNVSIRDNWFSKISLQGVLLFGQTIGCAEPDGSILQFLPLGTPRHVEVVDNEMAAVRIGVFSFISNKTSVRDNHIQAFSIGVGSLEDRDLFVGGNEIDAGIAGFIGTSDPRFEGPSTGNFVGANTISNSFIGLIVDCATTGYTILDNEFSGSLVADVILDGTAPGGFCAGIGDSFDNVVIATEVPTTVQDFGLDNQLIGDQIIDVTNP